MTLNSKIYNILFKPKLKDNKNNWKLNTLKNKKQQIIQTILDNKQWFFIPYNFNDPNISQEQKYSSRAIERKDLQNIDITTLITFLNTLQTKHSKMLGINMNKDED